ncbi:MAG: hypothetical protein C4547_09095, partial [Phycisphaerales bacterium]
MGARARLTPAGDAPSIPHSEWAGEDFFRRRFLYAPRSRRHIEKRHCLGSYEAGTPSLFERDFGFDHDWAAGEVTVSTPDGDDIVVAFDAAGRVETVTRESLTAEYDYFDDGQV